MLISFRISFFGLLFTLASIAIANASCIDQLDSISLVKIKQLNDSLKLETGLGQISILQKLNFLVRDYDPKQALEYAEKYSAIADEKKDPLLILNGGRMRAYSLDDFGKNIEAAKILLSCLRIIDSHTSVPEIQSQAKFVYNNLGLSYTSLGLYDKGLEAHLKALELKIKDGASIASQAKSYNNIGLVYYGLGNYDKAIEYFDTSNKLVPSSIPVVNRGLVSINLYKNIEAIKAFNDAKKLCSPDCSDKETMEVYEGLGFAYYELKQYNVAEKYTIETLVLARKLKSSQYILEASLLLGKIYFQTGKTEAALESLRKADNERASATYSKAQIFTNKLLWKIYTASGEKQKAFFYRERYSRCLDSTLNSKVSENVQLLERLYPSGLVTEPSEKENQEKKIVNSGSNKYWLALLLTVASAGLILFHKTLLKKYRFILGNKGEDMPPSKKFLLQETTEVKNEHLFLTSDRLKEICNKMISVLGDVKDPAKLLVMDNLLSKLSERYR